MTILTSLTCPYLHLYMDYSSNHAPSERLVPADLAASLKCESQIRRTIVCVLIHPSLCLRKLILQTKHGPMYIGSKASSLASQSTALIIMLPVFNRHLRPSHASLVIEDANQGRQTSCKYLLQRYASNASYRAAESSVDLS